MYIIPRFCNIQHISQETVKTSVHNQKNKKSYEILVNIRYMFIHGCTQVKNYPVLILQ